MPTLNEQFDALLAQMAPAIRDAFREAMRDVSDNAVLQQVIDAIEANDPDAAFAALGVTPPVFNPVVAAIETAFEQSGVLMMTGFPKYAVAANGIKSVMRFDMRDPQAQAWLRDKSSEMITGLQDDIRQTVRDTLVTGMAAGRNPRSVALDITGRYNAATKQREGGVIGLGTREEAWSRSARVKLEQLDPTYFDLALRDARFDKTVQAAIDSGKPLTVEVIDKLVSRYRSRALQHRGETIGRHEALTSMNRSAYESTRQALVQSDLPLSAATKTWKGVLDDRERHDHREMQNVAVGIDEPFVLPDGSHMLYPTDTSMGAAAKETILCYAPWVRVSGYQFRTMIRREYVGQLVNISIGVGNDISVTPNHPILTKRGWVIAGDVVEGDELLYYFGRDGVFSVKPNESDVLPTVEQLYRFHDVSGEKKRMSNKIVNFHGEIPDHDVDVISIKSELGDWIETGFSELLTQFSLTETNITQGILLFESIRNAEFSTVVPSHVGHLSFFNSLFARFRSYFSSGESVPFTDRRPVNSQIGKTTIDDRTRDIESFSDCVDRVSFGDEMSNLSVINRSVFNQSVTSSDSVFRNIQSEIVQTGHDKPATDAQFKHHVNDKFSFLVHFFDLAKKRFSLAFETLRGTSAIKPLNTGSVDAPVSETVTDTDDFSSLSNGQTFSVRFDNGSTERFGVFAVAKVSRFHYEGPVYNCETENGLVLANGVVSHNCRCRVNYTIDFAARLRGGG